MSTTATPPPVAPAASSAPSSAPSSTPSTPSTPVETSTPVSTPAASPSTDATSPSTEGTSPSSTPAAVPAAKPQPTQADFPGDPQAFLEALHQWERDNPEAEIADAPPPVVEEVKSAEEVKPEEVKPDFDKPWAPEAEAVTPEVVNGWAEKNPLLKQVWEQSPEIKNAMFALARKNAELAPMGELYPDIEAAQYASEVSGRYVDLRGAFTAAEDDPTQIGAAYNALASEFEVRDDKGNPVLDAQGNPTYTADFHAMNDLVVSTWQDMKLEEYEAAIAGGGDEDAEYAMQAIKFLKDYEAKKKDPDAAVDTSTMTPQQKAWFDKQKAELAAEREKLGIQSKEQTAAQKTQAVEAFNSNVAKKTGGLVGKRLDAYLAEKEANGIFIPSYALEAKEPGKNLSTFAETILKQFVAKTQAVAKVKEQLANLKRLAPSAENEQRRVEYNMKLVDRFLPDIIDAEVRKIQAKEVSDRERRAKGQQKRTELSTPEPQGGATRSPAPVGDVQKQAEANVAKNHPDVFGRERLELILQEKYRLSNR